MIYSFTPNKQDLPQYTCSTKQGRTWQNMPRIKWYERLWTLQTNWIQ